MPLEVGTAAGGVLFRDKHLLIIRRSKKSKIDPQKWEIPKGKVRPSEDRREALRREVKEEIGIEVAISDQPLFSRSFTLFGLQIRLYVYQIHHKEPNPQIQLSHEHDKYVWLTETEISQYNFATGIEGVIRRVFQDHLVE